MKLPTAARRSNMTPAFPKLFTSIQFRPQCNGLPVNEYPRRFLRKQALLAHSRTFLWSRHGVNLKTLPSDLLKITASCLKNNAPDESPLFSSRHNSTFRAFRWKLVTDLLPIGSRHQRWGNQSNLAGVCRICNSATEDISHLFSCHSTDRTTWVDQLHSALISRVPSIPRQLSVSLLADGVLSHSYGTISEPMKTAILPFVVEDQPFAQLAAKILRGCHDFIFNSIWKPRCQATIDQERQLGITTQQKRVYESRPSAPSSNPYKFGLSRLLDRANWSSINLELTTICKTNETSIYSRVLFLYLYLSYWRHFCPCLGANCSDQQGRRKYSTPSSLNGPCIYPSHGHETPVRILRISRDALRSDYLYAIDAEDSWRLRRQIRAGILGRHPDLQSIDGRASTPHRTGAGTTQGE